ncbi:MAG: hypothetical protein BWK80_34575 [Desulfobacteraceae bacterium IS3]|nr:MAG: hypothetical protein BWK80_34575 [Desulfobacteraceae bacterium IS3]
MQNRFTEDFKSAIYAGVEYIFQVFPASDNQIKKDILSASIITVRIITLFYHNFMRFLELRRKK